ncbi:MAG: hypothetical protein KIT84_26545 [Labilithrix sp.]|nr:hypothetical protein [Labilithrix sp.]MCW5814613.1 hypothetical protein [Labilithrix sp.]
MSVLETYELVMHAAVLEERLAGASAAVAPNPGMDDEKTWLETARRRIAEARDGADDVLFRVLRLPELASARGDLGKRMQGAAVSAIEKLEASIAAVNARSPLLEALFRNLDRERERARRLKREDFDALVQEIEKRLATSYVQRMLGDEAYRPVNRAIAAMRDAYEEWRQVFSPDPLPDEDAARLRDELDEVAQRLDRPMKQALLLAEAALIGEGTLLLKSGILDKPKRRPKAMFREDDATDGE